MPWFYYALSGSFTSQVVLKVVLCTKSSSFSTIGDNSKEEHTATVESKPNVCYCGRKAKSRELSFCTVNSQTKSRCPCVINHQSCSSKCCCLNCVNRISTASSSKIDKPCRCGESRKNKQASCLDIPGERRTKCPCFSQKQPCTTRCSCHKCGNEYGKREKQAFPSSTPEKRSPRCTSSPSSLKRKRSTIFHEEHEIHVKQGSWTLQETCILESVESFLLSTTILPSVDNIMLLYNFVISSSVAPSKNVSANQKTQEQVKGKLEFSHRRQEALRRLLYGIASI